MKSLKELYRIGKGPSSSHTIGPERACKIFLERNLGADAFEVILYGSLAKTGKGHGTDCIIKETISPVTIFYDETTPTLHPNAMDIVAYKNGKQVDKERVYSVGGGAIRFEHESGMIDSEVYPLNTFSDIRSYCKNNGMRLYEYVYECEGEELPSGFTCPLCKRPATDFTKIEPEIQEKKTMDLKGSKTEANVSV